MNKSVLSFFPFFLLSTTNTFSLIYFFLSLLLHHFLQRFFFDFNDHPNNMYFFIYMLHFFPCETFTSLSLFIQNFAFYCIALSSAFFLLSHCNSGVPPKDKFQYGLFVYIYKYTCLLMVMIMMIFS